MAKKLRKSKLKEISNKKKGKNNEKESKIKAIEILKKNIFEKDNNTKRKDKKILTTKKRQKVKEKRKKIKLHKIPKKNKKKKISEEEEDQQQQEESQEVDAEDFSLKKNPSKKKSSSSLNEKNKIKKQDSQQTILQMIKNRKNLEDVKLKDEAHINVIKPKSANKKKDKQKKENIDNKKEEIQTSINNKKIEEKEKNEFMKQIKSKIVIRDGKMVMEKPDVGLISKKYDEEHNKYITETIIVNDEEKLTSLSFLKKEKTKKWTEEETNNFYKALELFGLDFSFLSIVLCPRRREEIKRKYLKEKRKNPEEIERAIYSRKNVTKLSKVLNLYKNEKNQYSLSLTKSESFSKRKVPEIKEEINYNEEYKNILNKENS